MGSLVEVIQNSTRLHHLTFNIPTNLNPTYRYNQDICDALAGNVTIKTLGLDCYKITENEDKLLADIIRANRTIVSLTIVSDAGARDAGFTHITDAFKVNQGIRKIVLAGNFGYFGLWEIADSLQENTALEELSLLGCSKSEFDNWFAKSLADAIQHNGSLRLIKVECLRKIEIDVEGWTALRNALLANDSLDFTFNGESMKKNVNEPITLWLEKVQASYFTENNEPNDIDSLRGQINETMVSIKRKNRVIAEKEWEITNLKEALSARF